MVAFWFTRRRRSQQPQQRQHTRQRGAVRPLRPTRIERARFGSLLVGALVRRLQRGRLRRLAQHHGWQNILAAAQEEWLGQEVAPRLYRAEQDDAVGVASVLDETGAKQYDVLPLHTITTLRLHQTSARATDVAAMQRALEFQQDAAQYAQFEAQQQQQQRRLAAGLPAATSRPLPSQVRPAPRATPAVRVSLPPLPSQVRPLSTWPPTRIPGQTQATNPPAPESGQQ